MCKNESAKRNSPRTTVASVINCDQELVKWPQNIEHTAMSLEVYKLQDIHRSTWTQIVANMDGQSPVQPKSENHEGMKSNNNK